METVFNFNGDLNTLLEKVQQQFSQIEWAIHESDAYFTGRYILGKMGCTKITIEVRVEGQSYELAIS